MKFSNLFFGLLVSVALTACGGGKTDSAESGSTENTELTPMQERQLKGLEMEIKKVNKQLPMEMPNGLTMQSMELKDGYVVTTSTYPQDIEMVIDNTPEGKATIIKEAGERMTKRLKDINIGLKYIYIEEGTDKTDVIVITPEEL
ncbi:MAG: hypothetical protein K2J65_02790 [Duncaniella sp.]|nr:hypothetical protein [Duncaniella sp.]